MRTLSSITMLCTMLAGCGQHIPDVDNPRKIVVDGKPMTARDFLNRYCQGQLLHPSCVSVSRVIAKDATRGPMPKGW